MIIETKLELHSSDQASCLTIKLPEYDFWAEGLRVCPLAVALNAIGQQHSELQVRIVIDRGGRADRDTVGRISVRVPVDNAWYRWDGTDIFTREQLYDLEDRINYAFDLDGGYDHACA